MQAALAPSTVHTEHYTARQHLSSHLLSALKYVCKVSVCAVHAYRAKTCPSRPTQAPTMAAMIKPERKPVPFSWRMLLLLQFEV